MKWGEVDVVFAIIDRKCLKVFWIDFVFRVCMNNNMKTITLDEDAYERLKSWKRLRGDSFSAVVKRVVPRAGTLSAMASFAENRAPSVEGRDELLESTVGSRSAAKHDPWI
jgi:predicted CopG family antitoxin